MPDIALWSTGMIEWTSIPLLTYWVGRVIGSLKPTPRLESGANYGSLFWVGLLVSFHQGHLVYLLDEASVFPPLPGNHMAEVACDLFFPGIPFCSSALLSCSFPSSVILGSLLFTTVYILLSQFFISPLLSHLTSASTILPESVLWVSAPLIHERMVI